MYVCIHLYGDIKKIKQNQIPMLKRAPAFSFDNIQYRRSSLVTSAVKNKYVPSISSLNYAGALILFKSTQYNNLYDFFETM